MGYQEGEDHAIYAEVCMSPAIQELVVEFIEKMKLRSLRSRRGKTSGDKSPKAASSHSRSDQPSSQADSAIPALPVNPFSSTNGGSPIDTDMTGTSRRNSAAQQETALLSLNRNIDSNKQSAPYQANRKKLLQSEQKDAWDAKARASATAMEHDAQNIMAKVREYERIDPNLFGNLPGEAIPASTTRDMGGRYLSNLDRIQQSVVYQIAREIPKGCHLHLHFNSEIPPEQLFPHAKAPEMQDTMFIRSTLPLINREASEECEIVFNVFPRQTISANIFSPDYNPDVKDPSNAPWMLWREFRAAFPSEFASGSQETPNLEPVERWARDKMVINEDRAYGQTGTHNSIWACFNQGTRAFKGLLGYEGVYKWYIRHAIESMIEDKVMYAELRPMLLDKSIPSNDGLRKLGHREQMQIICDEVAKKKADLAADQELYKFPFGLKIIYCTPRSIPLARMKSELEDCIKLKLQFPDLICGFDLVGAEDRPNCIRFYADLLLAFQATCKELNIEIPFMFHAGETLIDTGGSSNPDNSNLYDALLLHAKRIGHGYALLKHPLLVEKYKKQNICLELCPISNELLHLCGNAREHPYPQLLAAGLHCTLNADNPSLFRSSLAHEFYQVMVGDPRMTIYGWKQLAEWSIEHSCLSQTEITEAKRVHATEWAKFCKWVVDTYGKYADSVQVPP